MHFRFFSKDSEVTLGTFAVDFWTSFRHEIRWCFGVAKGYGEGLKAAVWRQQQQQRLEQKNAFSISFYGFGSHVRQGIESCSFAAAAAAAAAGAEECIFDFFLRIQKSR